MTTSEQRAQPDERVPDRLTWWGTTWRVSLALAVGAVAWLFTVAVVFPDANGGEPTDATRGVWLVLIDPVIGLVATGLMLLRRRWPVTVAVVLTVCTTFSTVSAGPQTIALASLGTRQRWREMAPVALLATVAALLSTRFVYPDAQSLPLWAEAMINLLVIAVVLAIGYSIGSRRALTASWVARARTAEAEQRARVAQAQSAERTRIAREMHDVLAHRISLVTMHSGMLAYREDLPEDQRREAVTAIDTNARAALTDLREVLGVLREGEGIGPPRPQSTLADLPELLEAVRAAGTRVSVDDSGLDPGPLPETIGRTAYRVVQEGLTNARKHAPGTTVEVLLAGRPGEELEVVVRNPRSLQVHDRQDPRVVPAAVPGSGLGLLGLAERVDLAGGRLEHGWLPDGHHRLAVWLPWAP